MRKFQINVYIEAKPSDTENGLADAIHADLVRLYPGRHIGVSYADSYEADENGKEI